MIIKFITLTIFVVGASAAPESRIVGGTPIVIQEFPHVAALLYHYPGPDIIVQRCVGSIVSSWHILTSSFCFTGAIFDNFQVRAGSTYSTMGGTLVSISNVIKHPGYVETPRANDIAVIVVSSPLFISDTIAVLFIPPQGTNIPDGTAMRAVSWGFESESGPQTVALKTINLNKVSLQVCQQSYEGNNAVKVDDPVICAAGQNVGMCVGDSGAPMVIGQVIVGLSSYYEGCDDSANPDVFTRIDRYTNWILEVAVAPNSNGTAIRTATIAI